MGRPLRRGEIAPPFEARGSDGEVWSTARLRGSPFVLYFYPKDATPGCTVQGCSFRDAFDGFRDLRVPVLGVSRDSLESHARFAQEHALPFVLLADEDGAMHEAFGATMLGGLPRRISYLIDARGVVAAVFESHLRPAAHALEMLAAAREMAR